MADFYDGMTEETKLKHKKMLPYIELAEKQGDAVMMDAKPWELRIVLRRPEKKEKENGSGL